MAEPLQSEVTCNAQPGQRDTRISSITTSITAMPSSSSTQTSSEKVPAPDITIQSTNGSRTSRLPDNGPLPVRPISWQPYLLRLGPLAGLTALVFAFLLTFLAYAVLKASDGAAVTNWKYQPTVYLAIFTAISNKALAFAVVQGTVVTFWLRALGGTTLGQLHRDWGYGKNFQCRSTCVQETAH